MSCDVMKDLDFKFKDADLIGIPFPSDSRQDL